MASAVDPQKLDEDIAAVERDLEATALQAKEAEDTLARLKASEAEVAGRLSLASRAQAELEQRLTQLQDARREAQRAAAEQRVRETVAARDRLADAAAATIKATIAAIVELRKARLAMEHALNAGAAVGAETPKSPPGEPPAFGEQWSRLEQYVRQEANLRLESDLVETAANSPMGHAIKDLPAHLQDLAHQRRRALLKPP